MRCYLLPGWSLVPILLAFALASVAADEGSTKINVGVYYESLCGDSIRWIRDQLVPSYPIIKDFINLTFVPYGKALHSREEGTGQWKFSCQHGAPECEGNMAQACGIHAIQNYEPEIERQRLIVDLVGCAMSSRYPPTAVPRCAQSVGLSANTQGKITECIEGPLASELLAANGDKTQALNPSLTFVPTITINGVHSKDNQSDTLYRFLALICTHLPESGKPEGCVRE